MEERAPYGLTEASPPNLADALHPALERLGFVVQRLDTLTQTLLMAAWLTAERHTHTYQLLYTHARPAALPALSYVSLRVLGKLGAEELVADTHVRKLADVRLLLLNNCRYKTARKAALAAGLLQPA